MEKKRRVLVAEDSPVMSYTLDNLLTCKGFVVTLVEHGGLALDLLKSGEKFDMILTDHNMPCMTGLELLKAIRADDMLKDLPVIVHSSVTIKEFVEEVTSLGGIHAEKGNLDGLEKALKKAGDMLETHAS